MLISSALRYMKTCCVVPRRRVELSTQVKGALKVVLDFTLSIHVFSTLNLSFCAIVILKKVVTVCVVCCNVRQLHFAQCMVKCLLWIL
jgi:hypothetical protein